MPGTPVFQLTINGCPVHFQLRIAKTFWSRLVGLLGCAPQLNSGLLIQPCTSVHTLGMRYPIDVAFLARDGSVLKLVQSLAPMRVAYCRQACLVLETNARGLQALGLEVGDVVQWQEVCHNTA